MKRSVMYAMKRDMDLIRKILFVIEDQTDTTIYNLIIEGYI